MNKNFLLYGALGFLVVRYLMKQRQNAAPIVSIPLPITAREQQVIEAIPINISSTDSNTGRQGTYINTNKNNFKDRELSCNRPKQF